MRKSFFKKLSLGMALALVLGTTAHAGVAQAAEAWTLKKDSKILYLNEDNTSNTKNFYDFNFKNKPENWKEDFVLPTTPVYTALFYRYQEERKSAIIQVIY